MIQFTQEDVDTMSQQVFAKVEPKTLTGRGYTVQFISLPLDGFPDFMLGAAVIRKKGGQRPVFDTITCVNFGERTVVREVLRDHHLTTEQDLSGIVKSVSEKFADVYNALEKGESAPVHGSQYGGLGWKMFVTELTRDLSSYIQTGRPFSVTPHKTFSPETGEPKTNDFER